MKKKIILAAVAVAAVAAPSFAIALHNYQHDRGVEAFRCNFCKGTGFQNGNGNVRCFACKGSGFQGSY